MNRGPRKRIAVSEHETQTKSDQPFTRGRGDLAERRAAEGQVRIVRMQRVGDVERIDAELRKGMPDVEALHQRPIEIDEARTIDAGSVARQVAERGGRGRREDRRVEPQLAGTDVADD